MTRVSDIFEKCALEIEAGTPTIRASQHDKEFHFQNWVQQMVKGCEPAVTCNGRNTYPDFEIPAHGEGYEVKGLEYGKRYRDFDANSYMPSGGSGNRTIFYVFGRYLKKAESLDNAVVDLVVCHGDLISADRQYSHDNKHVPGFGSFGDVKIRDRKMYVPLTPYGMLEGVENQVTLILPAEMRPDPGSNLHEVGRFDRVEAPTSVVAYRFDLLNNQITWESRENPFAGRRHSFVAWRRRQDGATEVKLRAEPLPDDGGKIQEDND